MTVGVVGLGLLGGSIALELVGLGDHVVGHDPDPDTVARAATRGIEMLDDPAAVAAASDLVVVATPIAHVPGLVEEVAHGGATVTDVASVRAPGALGFDPDTAPANWVGGHPMAGTERRGFAAAHRGLVVGSPWLLTPHDAIDPGALVDVVELALRLGARPLVLDAHLHDTVVATTSHLTHLLSWALHADARSLGTGVVDHLAGPSFRDATRVAASSPEFWADLLGRNRDAVRLALDRVRDWLDATVAAQQDDLVARLAAAQRVPGPPSAPSETVTVDLADVATALADLRRAGAAGRAITGIATVGDRPGLLVSS
ncbi:prephenate dehydrogenase [Salsipaludibacter albus]|uniref:prephenate dehydrogenase n=1 Tax=Salsipaludibacter albus TaxID=2849650 RepID=UPI001EE42D5E|nr:prephenate dehydrogenase/arogenate dehydrogenase family protein [Salsipaludibacter albus]MBY5162355.1 prephenate dehydrogenase/arogenate dehydrogenase family protein [Salsipaludibacter albus]